MQSRIAPTTLALRLNRDLHRRHPEDAAEAQLDRLFGTGEHAGLVAGHGDGGRDGAVGRRLHAVLDRLVRDADDRGRVGGGELEGVAAGQHAGIDGALQLVPPGREPR